MDGVLTYELPPRADRADGADASAAFVIGPENALLAPPLELLLEPSSHFLTTADDAALFNPLVLVGTSGSGKSTLLQAVVRRWSAEFGTSEVRYFNIVDFGRELQTVQREGDLESWRQSLHQARLLAIDDLQRTRTRLSIHNALRGAIDAILDRGGFVLAASQVMPASLLQLSAGLRDRLTAGLTVQIQWPGEQARRELVGSAAKRLKASLDPETVGQLARSLEGSAARVLGAAGALEISSGKPLPSSATLTPQKIAAVVSRYLGVPKADILGKSRRKSLVYARSMTAHLSRQLTNCSFSQIGAQLGGRDHTTIIHADRSMAKQALSDPATQQALEELQRILVSS